MPTESTHSGDEEMAVGANAWDETMEMALCYAAIKYKPVGMHKHFRMINLHRHFNKCSPTPCTITELWEKLGTLYDLSTLDEREDLTLFMGDGEEEEEEEEEDEDEDTDEISFKHSEEFVLPFYEFDDHVREIIIKEEESRHPSPSPMRTTRGGSQTPSIADSSRASSPEDDTPRKRRTSRATKKSDVNETPSPRTSSATGNRRATRAKAEPVVQSTRGRKAAKKETLTPLLDCRPLVLMNI
ncbi:hypothetical protein BGZ83_002710 [Gryganskiella cystojenkinii]|nr:hypothetical protein BGZ83_002710 [Gryganskiella cystojenkinii]